MENVNNVFGILYKFFLTVSSWSSNLWDWLTNPVVEIGAWSVAPIDITGAVLVTLIGMKLVKDFIPIA